MDDLRGVPELFSLGGTMTELNRPTARGRAMRLTLSAGLPTIVIATLLANSDFIASAFAESNGWFGSDKTTTEKVRPSTPKSAVANDKKDPMVADKKEPAAAKPSDAKPADFQTMEQLQKAGIKHCLQLAQAVGQATMVGTSEYAAASTWHSKQPDNRFSVSMIGQKFNSADASIQNGVSGVFSAPTADGKCDAAALQIIPTSEPCAKSQALILEKGKSLGNLAGVPILQNAANAQIMLIPAANNSCVLVALSTVYTE